MQEDRILAVIGLLFFGIGVVGGAADAATTLSPDQPSDGYRVGMAVRACSTTTMAETPGPAVLSPSGATMNPPKDSDNCVAWVLTEPGQWRLTYDTTGLQGTQQVIYMVATAVDTVSGTDLTLWTAGIILAWFALQAGGVFLRNNRPASILFSVVAIIVLVLPMLVWVRDLVAMASLGFLGYHIFRRQLK